MATINQIKHGIPALISFFIPGLGQTIKGHFFKGFLIFVLWIFCLISIIWVIGLLLTPIIWILNIYDAYNSNDDGWK